MTTPSEEQGSGMPGAPEDAATGQPPGETPEVVRADETPAGGMKLSVEGVEAVGADGSSSSAGSSSNGGAPGVDGAAPPATDDAPPNIGPSGVAPF